MRTPRSLILPLTVLAFVGVGAVTAHAAPAVRCAAATAGAANDQQALRAGSGEFASVYAKAPHGHALDEMLLGDHVSASRWERVPELVVLVPVMAYEKGRSTDYLATADRLTDDEVNALVTDLTEALSTLTDNRFVNFAAIRRETAAAGETINVMRPGQIVVGRYKGVREQLFTIGLGGRSTRGETIRGGSIILDSDFDRTSGHRRLLRTHELGHALGYNHVQARTSIMNPRIGPGVTDFDRAAVRVASRGYPASGGFCR